MTVPRQYVEALTAVLVTAGASNIRIKMGSVHPRILYEINGEQHYHSFPGTPSDSVHGVHKSVAELKRKLGLKAAVKRVGERRQKRSARSVIPMAHPVHLTKVPDWHACLYGHSIMQPHLRSLLDTAWLAMWAECMRKAGGESLL